MGEREPILSPIPTEPEVHPADQVLHGVVIEFPPNHVTLTPPPVELPDGSLNPEYVEWGFQKVIEGEFTDYEGKPGRKPNRFQKLYEVFRGRENELIPLDEFAPSFEKTNKTPRSRASGAVTLLNRAFEKQNVALEVEGITIRGRRRARTTYRLRAWPHEPGVPPYR